MPNYAQYDGYVFGKSERIESKSYYCHNYYRGFDGEEIYALSDDDNHTEYFINGIIFAESFTSEEDVVHVFEEYKT